VEGYVKIIPMAQSFPAYQAPPNGFRTFLIVWITQSISVFGSTLTFFAITIWLTQVQYPLPSQKADLAWALSAIGLAYAIPNIAVAPFAGVWADRHDRKRTMMVMDFVSGCLSLILIYLIATHRLSLLVLLVNMALVSVVGAYHYAAFDTSYAMLVPEALLPRANGMMQTILSLSSILSPAVAAMLISLPTLSRQGLIGGGLGAFLGRIADGTPLAISLDALTFFVASATLIFLNIPSPQRTDLAAGAAKQASIWADIREGALYIWHRRPMLWLLGTFTTANLLLGMVFVLQPLVLKFNLAADWSSRGFTFETALALLGSVGGMGGVFGGVLISAWGGSSPCGVCACQMAWECAFITGPVPSITALMAAATNR
jgi:DHA3 family macrolide efflux protein-like MFS transporter